MVRVSILITFIFTLFLAGPTIITCIDDSIDISLFYNVNEEENLHKEIAKHLEAKFLESNICPTNVIFQENLKHIAFYQRNYSSLTQENLSPPPEKHLP